jgi:hypothetical protein
LKQPASRQRPSPSAADPEALSRDELRRLGRAERKLAAPDAAQAAAGRREIQDLERRHAERVEGHSLAARLAETADLARARGEEVRTETLRLSQPLTDEHGARLVTDGAPLYRRETVTRVRIASRGGLQLAFERGDLDGGPVKAERLYETGKSYRWAYEAGCALTTPARSLSPISGRSPLRSSAGPQDAVFAAGELLRRFRGPLAARQVVILDRVCGLDMTIRAAALALRADPRTVRTALVEALTAAGDARRAMGAA